MKRWLWLVLLLPGSSLFARNRKLQGYVMDPEVLPLDSNPIALIPTTCLRTRSRRLNTSFRRKAKLEDS